MNLLLLFSNLQNAKGGIPHYNQLLTRALRDCLSSRDIVTTLTLHDKKASIDEPGLLRNCMGFEGNRLAFVTSAIIKARRADMVIFGHAHFAALAWMMPKPEKILIVHGIDVWNPLSRMRTSGIRRMQQIWSVSRYTRDRLAAWSGIEIGRFHLLPNTLSPGIEREAMPPVSVDLPNGPILLTVSRLDTRERYKNIEGLLNALVALPEVFLVIVGEGTDRARLERLAQKSGVSHRVRFTRAVDDAHLQKYYEACDVFALPSTGEGFGIVFLEAMSHGKPCVGARAGGIPDVIEDTVTGKLVDAANPDDLKTTLQQLFADSKERQRLGAAGKNRFKKEFAFPHFRDRVETLLRRTP